MANDNSDCDLVKQLWSFLWNPDSNDYYLPNIIKNGLNVPILGIDIQPFATVPVPDIPTITLFKWALEYVGLGMTSNQLSGLDSIQQGNLSCTPSGENETDVSLSVSFGSVSFTGNYNVGASGVTGCAMATADSMIGGSSGKLAATEDDDSSADLNLAIWFRDNSLPNSDNGQVLNGMYYAHQDTIQALTTGDSQASSLFRQALGQSQATTDAVRQATQDYQSSQTGGGSGNPPATIGDPSQYAGGFEASAYLGAAAQQAANGSTDPTNEYVSLLNSMTHFSNSVHWVQATYPGQQSAASILGYVAAAPEDVGESGPGLAIHDLVSGTMVRRTEVSPLDREYFKRVWAARRESETSKGWFHFTGGFNDNAKALTAVIDCTFTNTGGKLSATVNSIQLTLPQLQITLGEEDQWSSQPGLYDKVSTWIANTDSFQDILKSKLNDALNADNVLQSVSNSLSAALTKLGF